MAGEQASVCGEALRSTCAIEVKGHKRRPPYLWEAARCPKTTFELADNMLFSLSLFVRTSLAAFRPFQDLQPNMVFVTAVAIVVVMPK